MNVRRIIRTCVPRLGICAIVPLMFLSATGFAQPPGTGPDREARGGRNRFGNALLELLDVQAVQRELKLGQSQLDELKKLDADDLRGTRPETAGRGNSGDPRAGDPRVRAAAGADEANSDGQNRARRNAFRLARQQAVRARLAEVLSPEQLDRLNQLYLQTRGWDALLDPEVIEALAITSSQHDELRAVSERLEAATEEWLKGFWKPGGVDRDIMRRRLETIRADADRSFAAVLTAEQQGQLKELQGKPFELPRDTAFTPDDAGAVDFRSRSGEVVDQVIDALDRRRR